jgi:hypothetical protein
MHDNLAPLIGYSYAAQWYTLLGSLLPWSTEQQNSSSVVMSKRVTRTRHPVPLTHFTKRAWCDNIDQSVLRQKSVASKITEIYIAYTQFHKSGSEKLNLLLLHYHYANENPQKLDPFLTMTIVTYISLIWTSAKWMHLWFNMMISSQIYQSHKAFPVCMDRCSSLIPVWARMIRTFLAIYCNLQVAIYPPTLRIMSSSTLREGCAEGAKSIFENMGWMIRSIIALC